jgi:hypothetical protein
MEKPIYYPIVIAILLFILLLSGLILNRTGSPYKTDLVTIHKLVSLAAITIFILWLVHWHRHTVLSPMEVMVAFILAGSAITALISGGLLTHKNMKIFVLILIHIISSLFLFAAAALLLIHFL